MNSHLVGGREYVPKLGMGRGEGHSYLRRLCIPDTDTHDLAHLLSLHGLVKEQ